jgi:hypothetical protein
MLRLLTVLLLTVSLGLPALAKDKPSEVVDSAPLRYGMELAAAEQVIGDAAMWRVAYRIDTDTTCEFAAVWSGSVFYKVKFLHGKCCYVEKRAEVSAEEVDQLLQMYRAVYGDSPEATSAQGGALIFSRWQKADREITISATGRHGRYKLFYEEFDPLQIADLRVAQDSELVERTETDPLTGGTRVDIMGQAAADKEPEAANEPEDSTQQATTGEDAQPDEEPAPEQKPEKKRSRQEDPGDW